MKTHVLWVPGVNLAIDLTICYVWQIRKRYHVEWKVCFWVSGQIGKVKGQEHTRGQSNYMIIRGQNPITLKPLLAFVHCMYMLSSYKEGNGNGNNSRRSRQFLQAIYLNCSTVFGSLLDLDIPCLFVSGVCSVLLGYISDQQVFPF